MSGTTSAGNTFNRSLTIKDLLSHQSGFTYDFLKENEIDAAYSSRGIGSATQKDLASLIDSLSDLPLLFSPGDRWNYSVSTDVCGHLVELISGQSLDTFFYENIFEPLGMSDTGFYVPAVDIPRFSANYLYNLNGLPKLLDDPLKSRFIKRPSFLSGGGGLVSTAEDYLSFCRMILGGGELNGNRILSRKTIDLMSANHLTGGVDLAEVASGRWSETSYQGMGFGLLVAAIIPTIVAGLIGYAILGLRGHYFAICTLGLGIAAGEIAGGIEIIGAGQGFTTPPFPKDIVDPEARGEFFYFLSFILLIATFAFIRWIYPSRFRLVLNAIRDNEDKAEAMGIQTMKYKIVGWMVSAFFCGLAGGIMGGLVGYIDSTDVAFDGREMGVFMVLMAILGGKGTLWGPVIGATLFHLFKEGFWTLFLGWQYVALGVLIVVIVIYFPEGLMGWLREKYPERFGEVIDEKDRKASVELK